MDVNECYNGKVYTWEENGLTCCSDGKTDELV